MRKDVREMGMDCQLCYMLCVRELIAYTKHITNRNKGEGALCGRGCMDFGTAIKTVREKRKLSQKKLARLAGLTHSYISLLEAGHRVPSAAALQAIAEASSVPMHVIVLIASDDSDLFGIEKSQAMELSAALFDLLEDENNDS